MPSEWFEAGKNEIDLNATGFMALVRAMFRSRPKSPPEVVDNAREFIKPQVETITAKRNRLEREARRRKKERNKNYMQAYIADIQEGRYDEV